LLWDLFSKGLPWPDPSHPELPVELARVFVRAVNRDQSKRYQSVAELAAAFDLAVERTSSDDWAINRAAGS
jgi:hypothetical protein